MIIIYYMANAYGYVGLWKKKKWQISTPTIIMIINIFTMNRTPMFWSIIHILFREKRMVWIRFMHGKWKPNRHHYQERKKRGKIPFGLTCRPIFVCHGL